MVVIKFKIKFVTNLEDQIKILVNLDKSFSTKPFVIEKPNVTKEIKFEIDKIPSESREDPCVILHTQKIRDNTFIRTKIYKISFFELTKSRSHSASGFIIEHKSLTKFRIYITDFEIIGKFEQKFHPMLDGYILNSVNGYTETVYHYLNNNFSFKKLDKVAIFYRDDLLYRMDLLSQLMVSASGDLSNEEAWKNLFDKMLESIEELKDFKMTNVNRRIMKKPRPYDPKTSWIDLIMYIPTKGYNYRTDYPKDNYSEPYFIKIGDCEDISLVILHFYYMFINCTFSRKYKRLIEMQKYARMYIPFFTFCISGAKRVTASGEVLNMPSGHICAFFISKWSFMKSVKDRRLIKLMKEKDPFFKMKEKEPHHKYLIGESTNIVKPYLEKVDYKGFDADAFEAIKKLLGINVRINFESVSDNVGVRVISDPNPGFYKNFGMLFTPYFYLLDREKKFNVFGFVCATKNEEKNELPYYGITFKDFIAFEENIMFYPFPVVSKNFIKLSEKSSRYQIPIPFFKMKDGKFEKITSNDSPDFYNYTYDDPFFKKLPKYFIKKDDKNYKVVAYCYLSDEDVHTKGIRNSLIDRLGTNDMKIKYIPQQLSYDTTTHFFKFYDRKKEMVYVEMIPVANKFLLE